jgi:hypothetical protein
LAIQAAVFAAAWICTLGLLSIYLAAELRVDGYSLTNMSQRCSTGGKNLAS